LHNFHIYYTKLLHIAAPEDGQDVCPKYVGVLYNTYKNAAPLDGSEICVILLAGVEI
jgi:hypothetical protein